MLYPRGFCCCADINSCAAASCCRWPSPSYLSASSPLPPPPDPSCCAVASPCRSTYGIDKEEGGAGVRREEAPGRRREAMAIAPPLAPLRKTTLEIMGEIMSENLERLDFVFFQAPISQEAVPPSQAKAGSLLRGGALESAAARRGAGVYCSVAVAACCAQVSCCSCHFGYMTKIYACKASQGSELLRQCVALCAQQS